MECYLAWLEQKSPPKLKNANLPPRPGPGGDYGGRSEHRSEGGRNRDDWDDYGSMRGRSRSRSRERYRRRSKSRSRDRHRRGDEEGDLGRREPRRHRSRSRFPSHKSRREVKSKEVPELVGSPRERRHRSLSPRRRRRSCSRSPRRRRSASPSRRGSPNRSHRYSSSRGNSSGAHDGQPLTPQSELGARLRDGWREEGTGSDLQQRKTGEDGEVDRSLERNGHHERGSPARARFVGEWSYSLFERDTPLKSSH